MIILGSQSPRRREILSFFSIPFRQISSDFDEDSIPFKGDPRAFVQKIAQEKANKLLKQYPNEIILTADTTVALDGRLFQKPASLSEAKEMLLTLSGQTHQVFSGVCVTTGASSWVESETSQVELHKLTENQIDTYHKTIFPLDKAGGYAIQQNGSIIVKRIEGCYYNIMGLPLATLRRLLLHVGIDLWNHFSKAL